MAITLADKQRVVEEVSAAASDALSAVVAEYHGLTVSDMTELRAQARKEDVYLRIVRNTLAKRALKDTEFSCLNDALKGPLFLALSKNAPGDAARLLKNFAKENENLKVKALTIGGTLLGPESLDSVASLPTKDEAIAKLLYVMKAPVEKLARTLAEPHSKLVRTLVAVKDAKSA